jgi:ribose transport system ATP-binding protein
VSPGAGEARSAVRAAGLAKRFGDHVALKGVDLEVEAGEVVALLGENGSGKSTLVKILAGYHVPEPGGRLEVGGVPVPLPVPTGAYHELGLAFVFQDLGLASGLRVVENLFVGDRRHLGAGALRPISWGGELRRARQVLRHYQVDVDPRSLVRELTPTQQALVAIVRAAEELEAFRRHGADRGPGLLVLDEPTVFLPEDEKVFLFELVDRVTSQGTGVLFVSHDLVAVRQIARRAVILRDGAVVGTRMVAEVSDEELVGLISGQRSMGDAHEGHPATVRLPDQRQLAKTNPGALDAGSVVLEARGVRGGHLAGLDLAVRRAEIVGVAGLLGSGSDEIPYALFGALSAVQGTVVIEGREVPLARLRSHHARRLGLALVPGDRKVQGAALSLPVHKNLLSLVTEHYFRGGVLRHGTMRSVAARRCEEFRVHPRDPDADMATLSGGNQQKVVLAKWLELLPKVLLLHEPTQGVDVTTRAEIYRLMRSLKEQGLAILWVSNDYEELAEVSDRVLVCAAGRIVGELTGEELSRDQITSQVYLASALEQRGA